MFVLVKATITMIFLFLQVLRNASFFELKTLQIGEHEAIITNMKHDSEAALQRCS